MRSRIVFAFLVIGVSILTAPGSAALSAQEAATTRRAPRTVAIVLFDGVQIIDYTGPYEVFGQAGYRVYTVAERVDTIVTHMNMRVIPTHDFENAPVADVLVVPGGGVPHTLPEGHPMITWLRKQTDAAEFVLSVCNGAFVLGSAGLLDGKRATTYAPMIHQLPMFFPEVEAVYHERFVTSGKIITAGGLSAGIDAALHVVALLSGKGRAQEVANNMEYNWDPESKYVRTRLADLLLTPILDVYPPLVGRTVLRYEGDETRWISEYEVPRRESYQQLNEQITTMARDAGWTNVDVASSKEGITTRWTFTDQDGRDWQCESLIRASPDKPGVIHIRLTLALDVGGKR